MDGFFASGNETKNNNAGVMGKNLDGFAEGLIEETLTEMAGTFFGGRKGLEDELERYRANLEKLSKKERGVLRLAGSLHFLLLCGRVAADFYAALRLDPGRLLDAADREARVRGIKKPFGVSLGGRYARRVYKTYVLLQDAVDEYLNGRHYDDPRGSGKKLVTVHHGRMKAWCKLLNIKIEKVNSMSPSSAMSFVKDLDPEAREKERIAGATLDGYAARLDKEMAFPPLDCSSLKGLAFPELPGPEEVKGAIRAFCGSLCARNKGEVEQVLAAW